MLFYEFLHIILAARAKNVNNATIFFNKRAMRNVGWKITHIPCADRIDFSINNLIAFTLQHNHALTLRMRVDIKN